MASLLLLAVAELLERFAPGPSMDWIHVDD